MPLKFEIPKEKLERIKNKLSTEDNIEIDIYNEEDVIIEKWHVTYKIVIKEVNKKECKIRKVEEIKEINDEVEESNDNIYSNKGEMDTDENIGENDDSNHKEDVTNNEDDTSSEEYRSGTDKEEIEKEVVIERSKAFYELLKDLNVSTVEESLESEENDQEVTLERLFTKAIKAGQEAVKCWYDVGKAVRNKVEEERNKLGIKEKSIRTKMYNELTKRLKGFSRKAIQSKIERAERVYKLFKGIGGRSKINRMKNTSMNTIINLKEKKGEVNELIRKVNEIEEERNSITEEQKLKYIKMKFKS
ncbi:uncharacterized protein OCT59_008587 [Rhizophagus irregularis]|uniref:Uncharacterized protein n=2 Tax=Rhizophagus irregularis TaxID=588596 RepID=A0A015ILA5_RHIIW|nr:hypothetical protein GLOIN_2v1811349 [Rhizophagus irregularis DAOM 181602=DAOM 197198]EXX57967.1 hypothetical protein RirG_202200 [Rhizophagus irregularis DAOM 197198w]POG62358.1 hypothetical protein GLOIN_2v1811349 [Rhizophagus irregularis DAOM 181602=DAOM 197198]UZO17226.1 hypothetical protein OCT59_008587 [Rhizophagus irregularis]GBC29395.1 hypothetical protein GLOIN_2v1811349 [Rhizophagus irregularis DAOM 181602=DAOM 197198]|eukprot:XP_025169224.1 hypothetical protein GLOIN_2v1811349 [Rhizophagus irregularis DAOM 181602=DAOM 197198]